MEEQQQLEMGPKAPRMTLFLDDNEDFLELAKLMTERVCGGRALSARSLREVIALGAEVFRCDLAILDINLGSGQPSGVEVYQWLRAAGFTQPVFFLTGHGKTYPLVAKAESFGDVTVLVKPLAPTDLVRVIEGNYDTVAQL